MRMESELLAGARALLSPGTAIGICGSWELDSGIPSLVESEELLAGTSDARHRDFALGRVAAYRALEEIGIRNEPVRRGCEGEPCWPPGVYGSISHSGGVGLAIATTGPGAPLLGIDIETKLQHPSDALQRAVLTTEERLWATTAGKGWTAVLFCAKEATYKALPTARGRKLGFQDLAFERSTPTRLIGRVRNGDFEQSIEASFETTRSFVIAHVEIERT